MMILTLSLISLSDPLREIEWMHSSKNLYVYTEGGTLFGVAAFFIFETPIFPADPILSMTGCDVNLLKAMIREESGFKVHAKSPTGALGVAQFVRSTAKWLGLRNPYNPLSSSLAMCRYVKYLGKKFKSTKEMLYAYHDGEGNVSKGKISEAAKNYANIVMKFYDEYKKSRRWEFFKDRWTLFAKAEYYLWDGFELRLGGAVSILGSLDLVAGYAVRGIFEGNWFVRGYLRIFHDLALIAGYEKGWEFGSSTWLGEYNLEVLSTPHGPEASVYLNGLGFFFKNGRIGAFYRIGM